MVALIARLDERDDTIIGLSDKLEALEMEHTQIIETSQSRINQLEKFIKEVCKTEPPEDKISPKVSNDNEKDNIN